ncbi:MAG: DNA mismatch repair protein MutS [Candidatus Krumholzibacteriota bacterium]|nr:DNA mismatch repair protein MutS [Candidatus Krumholzibacteriota bacterium]
MAAKTPLMAQYQEIKNQHSDGILFFQVGDFYETFYDDARRISRLLNITLTSRDKKNPVPLAGIPIHAAETYISRLLKAGEKVVICDQVENPSDAKGIVKRKVTDIVTPGTSLLPATLEEKENNYIICAVERSGILGIALMDISTGEFKAAMERIQVAENMLGGYMIREAIVPEGSAELKTVLSRINPRCSFEELSPAIFNEKECRESLLDHFGINNLSCFGIEEMALGVIASGALLRHVKTLRNNRFEHISRLELLVAEDSLFLDSETVRNLELIEPLRGASTETTLISNIDRTRTAAGARELRKWLMHPSRRIDTIEERLNGIEYFQGDHIRLRNFRSSLSNFPDMERILSRITAGKAGPRELLSLQTALDRIPGITGLCVEPPAGIVKRSVEDAGEENRTRSLIERSIDPESPARIRDGGIIRRGFSNELDVLIDGSEEGRKWIASLQSRERERTKISSLKIGYNKVFGYYIEVSKTHLDKVPAEYTGKQTLVSSQRYITNELKERENDILSADSRRTDLEKEIFSAICEQIAEESMVLQRIARGIAALDCISSLADLAIERGYCRPVVNESRDLIISEGRHPVVEVISGKNFIPNDIILKPEDRQFLLITGPNMGGKSTYIRQAALISILAQMGSFVPAARAEVGLMDRIFTRVGSSDNLARGQSTFLVEMGETAKILNNCTSSSLVLLDEIGRGTSTRDGLSIAWAVTEFLLEEEGKKPKALFATHFHELTSLAEKYRRIRNMKVEVREWGDSIVFLYRIIEGTGDRSYGIHVAQLAGIPQKVIDRAWKIFNSIEKEELLPVDSGREETGQRDLFREVDPRVSLLQEIDTNTITPLQALQIIAEIQKMSEGSQ